MEELSNILQRATTSIGKMYFYLTIDGGDAVFRERVYCYELYHQMRKIWPVNSKFVLNGELDKAAHPILSKLGADHAKPDLLIHTPGDMKGNYAIIEVKHAISRGGVIKDLENLALFTQEVKYKRAIYLIYGPHANAKGYDKIQRFANELSLENTCIEVWLHSEANQPARYYTTLGHPYSESEL